MIEIKNKQILIDGKPTLIMAGEIHYFRLNPDEWQDRIDKLKMAGCNAVATYVPWLIHEPEEGKIDLAGKTRPELDLVSFIDLCYENGLYFFLRPGPFIMAEMKNEGLPYWIYEKHPEIIPKGWDGAPAATSTVDYIHPSFLKHVKNWYKAVMEIVVPRLYPKGNIIALQLDNEIGMLSWVSNTPDLTDYTIDDFYGWLKEQYQPSELKQRYPVNLDDVEERRRAIRSPKEEYSLHLMKDLGYYMRNRFARYVSILRGYAEEFGVKNIPFIINIHGTSGGRGFTYPIGVSQLYESYTQDSGYLAGSDIYFGDMTIGTFQDLYLINTFMNAVNRPEQPLASVEFNCGDGNFGNNLSVRMDPSSTDFKARMCIAQGNRLLNYYLFAGGRNFRFDQPVGDGNDRIAHTGEHHGFAAPVGPTGKLNYTFPRMARSITTLMAVNEKIAAMEEEYDDIAFAFIPDYYMTEYHYPKSEKMIKLVRNLEERRGPVAWESIGRAMLLLGYRFPSINIQDQSFSPTDASCLVVPAAKYMSRGIQEKLVRYMKDGGVVILFGEVPQYDMEGKRCTMLADALGIEVLGEKREKFRYYLSVYTSGWAAGRPERRVHFAQTLDIKRGTPILHVSGTDEICGADIELENGRCIVISAAYQCDLDFYRSLFSAIGIKPGLMHDCDEHGIFSTSMANEKGERFIHLINLDGIDKQFHVYFNGKTLFEGRQLTLASKDAVMLPIHVEIPQGEIIYSTAEIYHIDKDSIKFRLSQDKDVIVLETSRTVKENPYYSVKKKDNVTYIYSHVHAKVEPFLTVYFE